MRKPTTSNRHVTSASKGMNTDAKIEYQPQGTSRFALNAVLETEDGDLPSLSNELGNVLCAQVKTGYTIIGSKQLDKDDVIIFSTNGTQSEIGLANQLSCEYTTLVNETCLNFKLDKRIKALFRILRGCERIVYFTDGINPYRVINIDSLADYYTNGSFDCTSLELSRPHGLPCFNNIDVQDGGGRLDLGTYTFRIRLLDADLNPTNWFLHTPTVPIVDDALSNSYASIDGGKNIFSSDVTDGGVLPSNKSIIIDIDSLDTTFAYYQLAVMFRTEGTGYVNAAYILQPKAIISDTDKYIYPGPNPNTDIYTQLSELSVDAGIIDVVEAHAQIDNRLFLGNMSYSKYDYAAIQRAANVIKTEWEISTEIYGNMKFATAKSPKAYVEHRSHMRDEVYAYAIRGHHKKGWSTPPFHIAGREDITDQQLINLGNSNPHYRNFVIGASGNWDLQLLTIVADDIIVTNSAPQINLKDVRHLGYTETDINKSESRVPRWKIYNTAIQYSSSSRGLMAYYECDERYPDIQDCDGNDVYPTKTEYTPTGQIKLPAKIRHHKFPDTTLTPIYSKINIGDDAHVQYEHTDDDSLIITPPEGITRDINIHPIGVVFDLTNFLAALPQDILDDFIEWEVMVAARDEYNKTVLDKGYIINTAPTLFASDIDPDIFENELKFTFPGYPGNPVPNPSNVSIFAPYCISLSTPSERFNVFLSPKETFLRKYLNGTYFKNERLSYKELIDVEEMGGKSNLILDLTLTNQTIPTIDANYSWQYKNRKISSSLFLDRARPKDNLFSIYTTDQGTNIYNRLYSKHIYHTTTQDPLISGLKFANTLDTGIVNTNDNFKNGISYASIKVDRSVYSNLPNIKYRSINACYDIFTKLGPPKPGGQAVYTSTYGGDIFISRLAHRLMTTDSADWTIPTIDPFGSAGYKAQSDDVYFIGFYESEINTELRHEASALDKKYLRTDLYQTTLGKFWDFMYPVDDDGNEPFAAEYFGYNIDYSATNDEILVSGLPFTYDYCSKCDNKFPFRLRYSEKSFQDQVSDKYRTFLPNNFTDLPGETLAVNNLFVSKEELYAHTPRALYFVPTRAQTLNTSETTVYLGTGDIFSIPPRRLASLDYAYGGSTDAFATVSTEFGAIFIDPLSGKVFLLRDGLKEISSSGQRNFFENNLKLKLNEYCKENFGSDYPYLSPTHPIGIGYTATFDTRNRRYILHKRDYLPTSDDGIILSPTDGLVKKGKALKLENSSLVRNHSYTVSYSLVNEAWTSFHSYLPDHSWNTENNFFTSQDNKIYKHNTGNYTTYYDLPKSDFILELVSNPSIMETKKFGPIQLINDCTIYDPSTQTSKDVYDSTFDRGVFFGSDISTGLLNITPQTLFSSVTNTTLNEINYERKGRSFNINDIMDVVQTDEPLFTQDWSVLQADFYIDKLVNSDAIDFNKSMYNMSRMVDRFMASRLYYKPTQNIKIKFEALIADYKPFIR